MLDPILYHNREVSETEHEPSPEEASKTLRSILWAVAILIIGAIAGLLINL